MADKWEGDIQKFGPFGRYNEVVEVKNGTTYFTSSAGGGLGAAAFMLSGSTSAGSVTLAKGGVLQMLNITKGTIYEIGISKAVSAAATEHILVLKR